ncbi:DNA-methyltransferase [Acinetobacter junii]|mgnify:FL=1|uniref:DNA-methyltransferase n=1 Tax=Acinetobacter junii TaxID=40215 RepID=UPI000B3C1B20|nr:site-specific DNA-methyltransferase [Acinetobacter junii]
MTELNLIFGDALVELKKLPNFSVDLIVADPPYNLGKDYGKTKDNLEKKEYLEFSKEWLSECNRLLKPNGTIYIFMGIRFISYIYQILEDDLGLDFQNWIVWHYTQGLGKKKGFSSRHDDILVFSKGNSPKFNLDDIRIPQKFYRKINNMRGANPGNVWEFSHVHYCNENRQDHPTQKPEGLIERIVLASSDENDLVLDPFSGSGTTLRVCQQLNRNGIGIEIHQEYVDLTHDRLSKEFNGFDSIDPRMERVPFDLRDPEIREEYLKNHENWFLKNHPDSVEKFRKEVKKLYEVSKVKPKQKELF